MMPAMMGRRIAGAGLAALLAAGCGGGSSSKADCEPLAARADRVLQLPDQRARDRLIERCTEVLSKSDIECGLASDDCLVKLMARLTGHRGVGLDPLGEYQQRRRQAELEMRRAQIEAARRREEMEEQLAARARLDAELEARRIELEEAEAREDPHRDRLQREYQQLL